MQLGPGSQAPLPGLGEDSQEDSVAVEQARGKIQSERHCREEGQSMRPCQPL